MTQILDGTGAGNRAKVDSNNRLFTKAVSEGPLEFTSEEEGNAAYFSSTFATGGSDVEVISIKNTDAKNLHITRITASAAAACVFTLFEVTSGTAGGTDVVYQNPNLTSNVVNGETTFGNNAVTGTLTGNVLYLVAVPASAPALVFLEGSLVLGTNDEIAITASANTTVYVTVIGFWD